GRRAASRPSPETQVAANTPRTAGRLRGKIMRRILRKIASNETDNLGDTSTLADPGVVDELMEYRAFR
ncbi:MAG: hypothetical protein R6W87_01315, partial [Halospina sp.]